MSIEALLTATIGANDPDRSTRDCYRYRYDTTGLLQTQRHFARVIIYNIAMAVKQPCMALRVACFFINSVAMQCSQVGQSQRTDIHKES